jgi:hypothetical protein
MLEYSTPEDNEYDNDYHKEVRAKAQEPGNSARNREFTIEDIWNAVESMDNK